MSYTTPGPHSVLPVSIEDEMLRSYLDYAMSVIVARALPDVRDGLKPVHRRILYTMKVGGYDWNHPYRKSANIVGAVMGKYHPHGDSAIYDAMVRMVQEFSMRLPLIDGQGNFGSMDGDPAAAMRYTEVRLAESAEGMLRDIDKETVNFVANYDDTTEEPSVLSAEFPNLLVNGAGGIAVGMATNIPPHNLGEVIDACLAMVDNPDITVDELMLHLPGPDFPTGGLILGRAGIRDAYHTGRGSIVLRGKAEIQEIRKDRMAIVVTEIQYQVNKARMIERIHEIVREKIIEGISALRDESDREGVRVVIELKRDAIPEVVLNQLYRFTPLQTSFSVNMLALNSGCPEQMNLRDVIYTFVQFREEMITRRTRFLLRKARDRAHILAGLMIAITNLDSIIELIRLSANADEVRRRLCERPWPAGDIASFINLIDDPKHKVFDDGTYILSDIQAPAILELRLQRLSMLERSKMIKEAEETSYKINEFLNILTSRQRLLELMRQEFMQSKKNWSNPRRTKIEENEFEHDVENLIPREEIVVTVSHAGYIKRVPLVTYRAQKRGGKGRSGMSTREEDVVSQLFIVNSHASILFFTSLGQVYQIKAYRLPEGTPQSRGRPMINLLPLADGEWIQTIMPMPPNKKSWDKLYIMLATEAGTVRRNALSDFTNISKSGKLAMRLKENDRLIGVMPCSDADNVFLATSHCKAIRFRVKDVRIFHSRTSLGVRGIKLTGKDKVVSMSILPCFEASKAGGKEDNIKTDKVYRKHILTVTTKGFGKRTLINHYRLTNRGGTGISNITLTDKKGLVAGSFPVREKDQIMAVTDRGQIIRCPISDLRETRRQTQGVYVFRVAKEENIVSVSLVGETAEENIVYDDLSK
ncbi:DNA gyrase, A subunit [Candidatus Endolissoclinum faulkneri L5]|uniref:DNA gyrase subunit A n=1 Tax=Candidatus Endolissoclinum faulkneri L5 TaxID=1401328 RepID=V9TT58_9PROT|nr:DNA gyrase subunit A [Candidatus Endolissoclinum faulkneri]AHC73337.1 DNA gyrase, A subunit [Candidatus Endolissoclinum faulkneri L5]